jgi:serine/threonine protein phosphatase PrpC
MTAVGVEFGTYTSDYRENKNVDADIVQAIATVEGSGHERNEDTWQKFVHYTSDDQHAYSVATVFDGHGGDGRSKVASRLAHHVGERCFLKKMQEVRELPSREDIENFDVARARSLRHSNLATDLVANAYAQRQRMLSDPTGVIVETFMDWDRLALYGDDDVRRAGGGSTAVAALIHQDKALLAWVGDSRGAILKTRVLRQTNDNSDDDEELPRYEVTVVAETHDHKPNNPEEFARITQLGGYVTRRRELISAPEPSSPDDPPNTYRVNGQVAMSRSFGDFRFKTRENDDPRTHRRMPTVYEPEWIVSCVPSVTPWINLNVSAGDAKTSKIARGSTFLVLATDGVCDALDWDSVATILEQAPTTQEGARRLVHTAQTVRKSMWRRSDDATAVVLKFV